MEDFSIEKKIYYHDTDCGGVVYYANYLKHLEEGRTEYCLSKGVDLKKWFKKGIAFVVVHLEVDYKATAGYGDVIKVTARVEKIGNSSIHFFQEIKKEDTVLIKAKTVWACISRDFKLQPVPQEVKQALLMMT
jgi:acyl-CoA thioester hydrolase